MFPSDFHYPENESATASLKSTEGPTAEAVRPTLSDIISC